MEEDLQKIRAIIRAERYRTSRIKLGLPLPPSEAHQPSER
jgi:hypothetical protein